MKSKSVLVATDLSARCDRPVDRALALAEQLHAVAEILHVVEPNDKARDESEVRMRVVATLPGEVSQPEILIVPGAVPETIARITEERGSALIVTGVARHNNVGDYFLGTAVDYIVRNAKVPVLVVKQRPHAPYTKLLIATDLSSCSRQALVAAGELFSDAVLHVVHAYQVPFETRLTSEGVRKEVHEMAQRDLDAFVNDPEMPAALRGRIQARLDYGETGEVIAKALRETNADLVVLGTHGKSGFVHATIGSQAESLLLWLPVDTLMVREQT